MLDQCQPCGKIRLLTWCRLQNGTDETKKDVVGYVDDFERRIDECHSERNHIRGLPAAALVDGARLGTAAIEGVKAVDIEAIVGQILGVCGFENKRSRVTKLLLQRRASIRQRTSEFLARLGARL
jgi:hypothetical protein